MAESYSVKAILSAADKGFTSTMKSASGYVDNLKSTLTSGLGFGMVMAAGQKAFDVVSSGATSLTNDVIDTSDAMQKLQQAMRFSGTAESEIQRIAGATGTLKTYADKTVFSLNDVMSTFGALSANGINDADRMVESVGNAVAVFGGGAEEFSRVGLAFSQAMAAGALHAEDWNQILDASPQLAGGLRKELTKLNPVLGEDFKGAMEDGAITAELLGTAMNNIGMTDMAKEAAQSVTTFEGAMGNLEATAQSGLLSLYDTFAKAKVVGAINALNDKMGAAFDWLEKKIPSAINRITPYFYILKNAATELKNSFGPAFKEIGTEIKKLTGDLNSAGNISAFWGVISDGTNALKTFAGFLREHADIVAKVLVNIPKLVVAYKGFKVAKAVAPFVGAFTGAIGGLAKAGISKLGSKLFGVSKGQEAVGKSSSGSSKKILSSAKAFMMLGAGVALISGGFYLLAQSAVALSDAGGPAIAVMFGLVAAVAALGAGMMVMMKSISTSPAKLKALSTAMLSLGAAVLMMSAGFAVLAQSSVALANAGAPAIATMFGMVVAIGALMVVASMVGKQLTAASTGMIAFGAAVLIAGAGMYVLSAASINLVNAGTPAIAVMAGMVVAMAGLMVLAAALGPALTAGAVGFVAFGAAIVLVATGALLASAALAVVASVLPTVSEYGLQGAAAIASLAVGLAAFAAGAAVAGAGSVALGAGLVVVAAGFVAIGAAVLVTSAGMAVLAVSLKAVNSSMKSIATNAKSAQKSLTSMEQSVDIVSEGLDALGSKAKSAINSLIDQFRNAEGKAKSSGKAVGDNFNNGVSAGMKQAVSTTQSTTALIIAAMRSGQSGAYSSGVYIGQGLANGMWSQVGAVRAAAASLAAAAEAAIVAKAKIGSPSKVSTKLGGFWGIGWVNGILSKVKAAKAAAIKLISIPDVPNVQIPSLAGGGSMSLDEAYTYNRGGTYTIYVPVEIEGREVAKASAVYTQEELEKLDKKNKRKGGIK